MKRPTVSLSGVDYLVVSDRGLPLVVTQRGSREHLYLVAPPDVAAKVLAGLTVSVLPPQSKGDFDEETLGTDARRDRLDGPRPDHYARKDPVF